MEVTLGRIVLYTLHEQDTDVINSRRLGGPGAHVLLQDVGAQAHVGNKVETGQKYPMLVTKVWSPGYVNGQVFLDGNDSFWATSVQEGSGGHSWAWPPRS